MGGNILGGILQEEIWWVGVFQGGGGLYWYRLSSLNIFEENQFYETKKGNIPLS